VSRVAGACALHSFQVVNSSEERFEKGSSHSSARRVRVVLGATEEKILVEVSDDGVGFDQRQSTEGVGLSAMRERTAQLSEARS
jgi:signal transduction histidine kinase